MKKTLRSSTVALLAVILVLAAAPASAAPRLEPISKAEVRDLGSTSGAKVLDPEARADKACEIMTMECNTTINSLLEGNDCTLTDGSFIDYWDFLAGEGTTVTASLSSSEFNVYLFLANFDSGEVEQEGEEGGTPFEQIVHQLGSSGVWSVGANGWDSTQTGNYTVELECTSGAPPLAPSNLNATALSESEIQLDWTDNSHPGDSNNEDKVRVEYLPPGASGFLELGDARSDIDGVQVTLLDPETQYSFRVKAINGAGESGYSNVATATTASGTGVCVPSDTNLCLLNGRFRVEVQWRNFEDVTGPGTVVLSSSDSGLFWFFDEDNWEMLVKMVDACGSEFNSFWVFAAATTNVEYTLTVTDTQTGDVKPYFNPLGRAAPAITDTAAFATCP